MNKNSSDSTEIFCKECLDKVQKRVRRQDFEYISKNREIQAILRVYIYEILKERPTDVYAFAANLFNEPSVYEKINDRLKSSKNLQIPCEDTFNDELPRSESSFSLASSSDDISG